MKSLPRELLTRLGSLIRRDDIQTAQIRVFDLQVFKARLSEKWERVGAFVHKSFENAIRKHLSLSDAALHYDELTYLVVFRDATFDTAQLKSAAILTEVVALCFGEQWESGTYEDLVHRVDPHSVPMSVTSQAAFAKEKSAAPPPLDVTSAPDTGSLQFEDQPWQRPNSFLYRPLWDAARNVVLHYLCQPQRENPTPQGSGADAGARHSAGAIGPEPDFVALQECVSRIEKLRREGFRVVIGAQIHFETLSDSSRWRRCAAVLNQVPRTVLDDLGFVVIGIDDGVPSSRLQTVLTKLGKTSRSIYCVVQDSVNAGLRFAGTGTHALGIVMRSAKGSERSQIEKARTLASEAADHNMEAFILNATTPSLALNAIASGIRYVAGDVICPPTADPRYAFVREIEDLYRDKFKRQPEGAVTHV